MFFEEVTYITPCHNLSHFLQQHEQVVLFLELLRGIQLRAGDFMPYKTIVKNVLSFRVQ